MEDWDAKRLEATVQTAALCAYVDGHLAPEEREKMCECIAIHAESEEEAQRLIALAKDLPEWVGSQRSGFRASQYAQIKAVLQTPKERERAFTLAVQVAVSHQGIAISETSFLLDLMAELEIDPEFARNVMARTRGRENR